MSSFDSIAQEHCTCDNPRVCIHYSVTNRSFRHSNQHDLWSSFNGPFQNPNTPMTNTSSLSFGSSECNSIVTSLSFCSLPDCGSHSPVRRNSWSKKPSSPRLAMVHSPYTLDGPCHVALTETEDISPSLGSRDNRATFPASYSGTFSSNSKTKPFTRASSTMVAKLEMVPGSPNTFAHDNTAHGFGSHRLSSPTTLRNVSHWHPPNHKAPSAKGDPSRMLQILQSYTRKEKEPSVEQNDSLPPVTSLTLQSSSTPHFDDPYEDTTRNVEPADGSTFFPSSQSKLFSNMAFHSVQPQVPKLHLLPANPNGSRTSRPWMAGERSKTNSLLYLDD